MKLAPQQVQAKDAICKWYASNEPVFFLGGWAGTGKTSLAKMLAEELGVFDETVFGAFTGKAAYVLTQRGCPASTMHSIIYHSGDDDGEKLREMHQELKALELELKADGYSPEEIENHPSVTQLQGKIFQEEKQGRKPKFRLNPDSRLKKAKLGVIDEVSMVNGKMKDDWMSFGVKTLVLGDPFQLPPVAGEGAFTKNKPNFMLTEIHRQAEGNPIIYLASMIRNMERPAPGSYGGGVNVRRKNVLDRDQMWRLASGCDQIIVGENKTRHAWNDRVRERQGFKSKWPQPGERVVCLKNDHELGLLNGALYTVVKTDPYEEIDKLEMTIKPVDGSGRTMDVTSHTHHFLGQEEQLRKAHWIAKEAQEFDFGYALTCHKAQGSQFGKVLVWDESYVARNFRYQWLYTAVTRAEHGLELLV